MRRCRRVTAWTETEALAFEKEALGLYMSGHPLQRYADALAVAGGASGSRDLTQSEADCAIAGVVDRPAAAQDQARRSHGGVHRSRTRPPRSKRWCSPRPSAGSAALVVDDAMLLVRGKYERDEETEPAGRRPRSRRSMSSASAPCARSRFSCRAKAWRRDAMRELADVFERHPGDRRVSFVVEVNGGDAQPARPRRHRPPHPAERPVRPRRRSASAAPGSVVLK